MAVRYTEEELKKLNKDFIIKLFMGLQDQMEELTKQMIHWCRFPRNTKRNPSCI